MLHAYEALRELTSGEYLGAETYFSVLSRRSHWLYGQAHGQNYPFNQREGQGIAQPIWVGETPVRSEHMTLKFSARVNLNAPDGIARLQYYRDDGQWIDIATDVNTGLRFFGGITENSYDLSALSPAQGMWVFRFLLTGAGGWGIVYRAYLSGTTGFPTWPSLPTFTDGTVPTAADINKLRTMQEYLYHCARQPRVAACLATVQAPTGGPIPLFRYQFVYGCTRKLHYNLTTSGLSGGNATLSVYLEPDTYCADAGDSRIATLRQLTSDVTDQGYDEDLSAYGLTQGERYTIEFACGGGAFITLNQIVFSDLVGVTRTYIPKSDWAHGDYPTAAQLNTIRDDLNQLYPDTSRESPLWLTHELASWQYADAVQGGGQYSSKRFRLSRRWRYLRYRGAGRLVSADGSIEVSLSDTDPAGVPQVLDLESTPLPYGMAYYVESYGDNNIAVAYEDYA